MVSCWAAMSAATKTIGVPFTVTLSPTTASAGSPMVTLTLPSAFKSALSMLPSPPSSMMTVGALGAVVSTLIVVVTVSLVLPAGSVAVAIKVSGPSPIASTSA